jgi:hypothetical protein
MKTSYEFRIRSFTVYRRRGRNRYRYRLSQCHSQRVALRTVYPRWPILVILATMRSRSLLAPAFLDGGTVNIQLLMPESHGFPFDSDPDSDPESQVTSSTEAQQRKTYPAFLNAAASTIATAVTFTTSSTVAPYWR